jgi:hypothetical protein
MYPVAVCLACGARSKSEACARCSTVRQPVVFRELPTPRLRLLAGSLGTGVLGSFLTVVGVSLVVLLVSEARTRTTITLSLSVALVLVILGFGLWLDAVSVRALLHGFARRWEVFGGGGAVSGVVTTLFGFVLGGGVIHDRPLHRARKAGLTSAIVERSGIGDVLACGLPGIANEGDLTIWSALAGLVTLDLAGLLVIERHSWRKTSPFRFLERSVPVKTLLLERQPTERVPGLAPVLEKKLARALDGLGWSYAPKTLFDLTDVLHQMRSCTVDTPVVSPADEILTTGEIVARLVAFREDVHGSELRFAAMPVQVAQVVEQVRILTGRGSLATAG